MATNLYKYYSHTQLILESFCKKLKGLTFAQPQDQRRMVFVDSDVDNLGSGNLTRSTPPGAQPRPEGRRGTGGIARSGDARRCESQSPHLIFAESLSCVSS